MTNLNLKPDFEPEELDGLTIDEMVEKFDEQDAGPEQIGGEPEPEIEQNAGPQIDEEAMSQMLGNALGGVLDAFYNKIGARTITEKECKTIGEAAGPVIDKYLPDLMRRFPQEFMLCVALGVPTMLRIQEVQFEKRRTIEAQAKRKKSNENASDHMENTESKPNAGQSETGLISK